MRYVPAVTPFTLNVNVAISLIATTSSLCTAGRPGCGQLTAIFGSKFALLPTNARLASDPVPRVHATLPVLRNLNVIVASAPTVSCAGAVWSIHALSRSESLGSGAVAVGTGGGVGLAPRGGTAAARPETTDRNEPVGPAQAHPPTRRAIADRRGF